MRRIFFLAITLALLATGALALSLPHAKPDPLPAQPGMSTPRAPRCAVPLQEGCMRMQSSCRMACPPMYSTSPSAPAFTPTNRAQCTQQCLTQYQRCMVQYGCT